MQIDTEYTLKKYTGSDEVVVIPEGIRKIGKYAFYGNGTVKEIQLPETLIEIEEYAFLQSSIERIVIPENVSVIGGDAFRNCEKLEHIVIPKMVRELKSACFEDCITLKSVSLPEELKKIGQRAFSGCTMLSDITLPEHLQCLEDEAFFGCSSLKECILYPELEHIGKNVFTNCFALKLSTNLSEEDDDYWDYYGCEAYEYVSNAVPQDAIILACPICGQVEEEKIGLYEMGCFDGAALAAYGDARVKWKVDSDQIYAGLETTVTVYYPLYCRIGDYFSVCYGEKVITAQLKAMLTAEKSSAEVIITVTDVKELLEFIKPLSNDQADKLRGKSYDKSDFPKGNMAKTEWQRLGERWLMLYISYSDDETGTIYIYTDDAGADHLVKFNYSDFEQDHCFLGDKVLGLHEEIEPFYGLLLLDEHPLLDKHPWTVSDIVSKKGRESFYSYTEDER